MEKNIYKLWSWGYFFALLLLIWIHSSCRRDSLPILKTTELSNIREYSAESGGKIIDDGGKKIVSCGVCWSKNPSPKIEDNKSVDVCDGGNFTSSITGLEPGTSYYVRAYATNGEGTGYGNAVYLTTFPEVPSISPAEISSISASGAIGSGQFFYGNGIDIINVYLCFGSEENPTLENLRVQCTISNKTYSGTIKGLDEGVLYYVRSCLVFTLPGNSNYFAVYGSQVTVCTGLKLPTVVTLPNLTLETDYVVTFGSVSGNGGEHLTSRGFCIDTLENPGMNSKVMTVIGDEGSFQSTIDNLLPGHHYYYRAFATNSAGTSFGDIREFMTYLGKVQDLSGNIYNKIRIGSQVWMKENLQTRKYNDGTEIKLVELATDWGLTSDPAYCFYDNNERVGFGALYNWYCVNSGKLCPSGWHIPTPEEWDIMSSFLGGESVAGGKMRDESSLYWQNAGPSDNMMHFTALPGGFRYRYPGDYNANFYGLNHLTLWWTSSSLPADTTTAMCKEIKSEDSNLYTTYCSKIWAFSIRCISDN